MSDVKITRNRRTADSTQIYVVRDGEFAKIGIAADPIQRTADLQTGNPRALSIVHTVHVDRESAARVEAQAHFLLREQHVLGEWFRATDRQARKAVRQAIERLADSDAPSEYAEEIAEIISRVQTEPAATYDDWLKRADPARYEKVMRRRAKR